MEALDETDPAKANPLASGLPLASEASIVTRAGVPSAPPITSAFWTMWLAVRSLPALTTVSPLPSTAPTC